MIDEEHRLIVATVNDLYAMGLSASADVDGFQVFDEATGERIGHVTNVHGLSGFVEGFRAGRESV